jgi:hypothetical protein
MSKRIKAPINDDFTKNVARHINNTDLPDTYSVADGFIYKIITDKEYHDMIDSIDGIYMEELGISARLDTEYNEKN